MLRLLKSPIREWNSSILEQPLLEILLVAQARLQSSLGVTGEIDQPFEGNAYLSVECSKVNYCRTDGSPIGSKRKIVSDWTTVQGRAHLWGGLSSPPNLGAKSQTGKSAPQMERPTLP